MTSFTPCSPTTKLFAVGGREIDAAAVAVVRVEPADQVVLGAELVARIAARR